MREEWLRSESNVAALILAGGRSSRMGFPKAFLKFAETNLCEHIARTYLAAGIGKIIIVLNSDFIIEPFMAEILRLESIAGIIPNDFPERGRSYSIQLGMRALEGSGSCFVHNVDNPVISADMIRQMSAALKPGGYVAPMLCGRSGHPVLIEKTIMEEIVLCRQWKWILKDVLRRFERTDLDIPDSPGSFNINTQEDWSHFLHHLETGTYVLPGHAALVGEDR